MAYGDDDFSRTTAVTLDIGAGDIRQRRLIPKWFGLEHQALLATAPADRVDTTTEIQTQLERHVEPEQLPFARSTDPREIVDRIHRLTNQSGDLVYPRGTGILALQRDPRIESEIDNREQKGMQQRPVFGVEGTVDEDVTGKARPCPISSPLNGLTGCCHS